MDIVRIKSGVPNLDDKIEGGFEQGSSIVLGGGPGTGKTLFGLQFVYQGVVNGENSLYVSFEESPEDIIRDMEGVGLDAKKYTDDEKLIIKFFEPTEFEDISATELVSKFAVKRVVIDSISALLMYFKDEFSFRKFLLDLIWEFKKAGITTLFINEQDDDTPDALRTFSDKFLADSFIAMQRSGMGGDYDRSLQIVKMRRTSHFRELIPMKIDKQGISLK